MRELKENFIGKGQVKGFIFTQIKKSDNAYIYEVKAYNSLHYEVFTRKENNYYNCVSYPSNKAFGTWAKTFKKIDEAVFHFELLTNKK